MANTIPWGKMGQKEGLGNFVAKKPACKFPIFKDIE
jgi:hypothetical protein